MLSFLGQRRPTLPTLSILVALLVALALPSAASAGGEPGTPGKAGTAIRGVAAESSGTVIAVGQAGANMLVQRFSAAGAPSGSAFAAGAGSGNAVAIQPDGKIVVAGVDGGIVVRRFNANGSLDTGFGAGGTAKLPSGVADAVAIAPDGKIVVAGNIPDPSDAFPRVAVVRLNADGSADKSFSGDGVALPDLGRNAKANGVAVQSDGKVVIGAQRAPGLQITEGFISRLTTAGALDTGFASGGTYTYDAQGGVNATIQAVAVDPSGRILGAGTDIRGSGLLAVFVRLSPTGALDGGFGKGGIIRTPASVNTNNSDTIGARSIAVAGNGEVVAAGSFQDSGQRSAALWAINAAGQLDPTVGKGGLVLTLPGQAGGESFAVTVAPNGTVYAGGQTNEFSGPNAGFVLPYGTFGPLPTSNGGGGGGGPVAARAPAKLAVLRNGIKGTKLDVLASTTSLATGSLKAKFVNNGTTTRFTVKIPSGKRLIPILKTLSTKARKGGTGILTLTYAGNDKVKPDDVRLRAATGKALLTRKSSSITSSGNLKVAGTTSTRAHGVVRIRMDYNDASGKDKTLAFRATIKSGKWSLNEKLPTEAQKVTAELSIQFTGYVPHRIRGEQKVKQVKG